MRYHLIILNNFPLIYGIYVVTVITIAVIIYRIIDKIKNKPPTDADILVGRHDYHRRFKK
jgi:hypothetical protein